MHHCGLRFLHHAGHSKAIVIQDLGKPMLYYKFHNSQNLSKKIKDTRLF